MSIASGVFAWRKSSADRVAKNAGAAEAFPTHTRVVLHDGTMMLVRVASLSAAKDLLAAQRAVERRLAAHRERALMTEATRIVVNSEVEEATTDHSR